MRPDHDMRADGAIVDPGAANHRMFHHDAALADTEGASISYQNGTVPDNR
jgi:hypothetical protein